MRQVEQDSYPVVDPLMEDGARMPGDEMCVL